MSSVSVEGFYGTVIAAFTMLVDFLTTGRLPDLVVLRSLLSKVLGYSVVVGASIIKLPQIINVITSGSVEGLAASTFEIEAFAFGVNLSNMTMSGMPFSAYGELVFVIIQNIIILLLIHMKTTDNIMRATGPLVLMGSFGASVYMGQIPYSVIETLTSSTLLFIFLARIPQIINIYKKKSSGQLSGVSQFLMVAGGLARVFTGLTEGASVTVLIGTFTSMALNLIILIQIIMYRKRPLKAKLT